MALVSELIVVDSRDQPAASCLVCGNEVPAGAGLTARYRGRTLRFKCPGCYSRFLADPEPYLAGHQAFCCDGAHDHSPASEWN
jgi:YHS domain-containing protein